MIKGKKSRQLTWGLFILYFIVLTWAILLKLETSFELLASMNLRNINLIPFAESTIINGKIDMTEIILNVIAFIPFGVYMAMLCKSKIMLQKVLPIFYTSLGYEVLQYIFAIGASDITDLIGNTLGGIIGVIAYMLCTKLFKDKTDGVINGIATVGSVSVVALLGTLTIINL